MDHKQLAAQMFCSWGLVRDYQWTCQSIYMCLPGLHILEAYNHKVNDTHKELPTQEHVVMQYAWALQYTSFCNNERYKDRLVPAVWHFWEEVIEPFGSRALCNLDPSHLLGDSMCLDCGAKIPDYGVWEHIAFVCMPFFEGIESHLQYEQWRKRPDENHQGELTGGDNHSHSCTPNTRGQELEGQESEHRELEGRSHSKSMT